MKKSLITLTTLFALVGTTCFAQTNLIQNGSFESGEDYWTLIIHELFAGDAWLGVLSPPTEVTPISSLVYPTAPDGDYIIAVDQDYISGFVFYQDFEVPHNLKTAVLSYQIYYLNYWPDFINPNHLLFGRPNQQARVDILTTPPLWDDAFSVLPEEIVHQSFRTMAGDPLTTSGWKTLSQDIAWLLKPYEGQTLRLRFAMTDTQLWFDFAADNISLWVDTDASVDETLDFKLVTSTESLFSQELDPGGKLGGDIVHQVIGSLPQGLQIVDGTLTGYAKYQGTYTFAIKSVSGTDVVYHNFVVEVLTPTLHPVFTSLSVNGERIPVNVLTAPTHNTPAKTELVQLSLPLGEPASISFLWDYIKGESIFKLLEGPLPEGLTFSNEEGTIFGTPTESGEFVLCVSVKDWRGRAYQWILLTVE